MHDLKSLWFKVNPIHTGGGGGGGGRGVIHLQASKFLRILKQNKP